MADPNWKKGDYYSGPKPDLGLALARMIGHITYLSDDAMRQKFGRRLQGRQDFSYNFGADFQVESYLQYQGRSFSQRFDANTYLLMTRALDYFDPASEFDDSLSAALSQTTCRFCVISFTTDWRFSAARSKEIVDALISARRDVCSAVIASDHGHDSFLLPIPRYFDVLGGYLGRVADEVAVEVKDAS